MPSSSTPLGVPTQLVVYPGENHTLEVPSYVQDRLERLIDWNLQHLVPDGMAAK